MRLSHRKVLFPALVAAGTGFAFSSAAAGGFSHHVPVSGHHHAGHGWHGGSHHGHGRHDFRPVRVLIAPDGGGERQAPRAVGRAPGVPDAVPYTRAGPGVATTGVSYVYGGYGLPSEVPAGTYVGGVDAVYIPGNGSYYAVDGNVLGAGRSAPQQPGAKIITVTPDLEKAACTMEKGVCIIRP